MDGVGSSVIWRPSQSIRSVSASSALLPATPASAASSAHLARALSDMPLRGTRPVLVIVTAISAQPPFRRGPRDRTGLERRAVGICRRQPGQARPHETAETGVALLLTQRQRQSGVMAYAALRSQGVRT